MGIDIASMDAAQKLAFAQATGQVLLGSVVVSSPVAAFVFALSDGYYDYLLVGRNINVNSTAAGYVTFAFGDEGVAGSFYKDDVDFLGYQIDQEVVGVGSPNIAAQSVEDGYGYALLMQGGAAAVGRFSAEIYPGSASSFATLDANGASWLASSTRARSYMANTLTTEQARMNAIRICTPFDGGQINTGEFALFGRAFA